jgi:hypothetical protein
LSGGICNPPSKEVDVIPRCIALCGPALSLGACRASESETCCYDWVLRKGTCPAACCA